MRHLSEYELDLVAGGTSSSDYWDEFMGLPGYNPGGGAGGGGGGGGMWLWIAVPTAVSMDGYTGTSGMSGYWSYYAPTGNSGSTGGGGGGGSTGVGHVVAPHTQDCSTDDGAAVQVAKHVMGSLPGGASGPTTPLETATGNDWTNVEFGAIIVRNANGTYGAYQDSIYSDDKARGVNMSFAASADVAGTWHSHASGSGGIEQNYPSGAADGVVNDWQQLQSLKDTYAPNNPSYDPSLWITGPDGITREFKLSQKAYYEGLTAAQKSSGIGLSGTERTSSCS